MPNIPQITAPVSNNKSYSFTNRQYDGNIEPFDMVELAQPIKTSTAQDNDSAAAMMMGRKNLAPLTVQIKDPTMAVETLKNLLSSDLLEQTMINGYTELYDDMNELIKSFYLAPEKLVREIQNQEKQNTMFSGDEFYKLLHGILKTTTSPDIKESIGQLLKALNYSSNKQEILNALGANLKFLSEYFSPNESLSRKLANLSSQWKSSSAADMFEPLKSETLALLKDVSASLLNDERTQTFIPLIIHIFHATTPTTVCSRRALQTSLHIYRPMICAVSCPSHLEIFLKRSSAKNSSARCRIFLIVIIIH